MIEAIFFSWLGAASLTSLALGKLFYDDSGFRFCSSKTTPEDGYDNPLLFGNPIKYN